MDKLPDDVTHRINKAVKSMGDGATSILSNSVSYYVFHLNCIFINNGAFLPDIYVKIMKNLSQQSVNFSKENVKFLL